jgi:hypothetical protein
LKLKIAHYTTALVGASFGFNSSSSAILRTGQAESHGVNIRRLIHDTNKDQLDAKKKGGHEAKVT